MPWRCESQLDRLVALRRIQPRQAPVGAVAGEAAIAGAKREPAAAVDAVEVRIEARGLLDDVPGGRSEESAPPDAARTARGVWPSRPGRPRLSRTECPAPSPARPRRQASHTRLTRATGGACSCMRRPLQEGDRASHDCCLVAGRHRSDVPRHRMLSAHSRCVGVRGPRAIAATASWPGSSRIRSARAVNRVASLLRVELTGPLSDCAGNRDEEDSA